MEALNLKEQSINKHHKLMKTMAIDDDILLFHILPRLPARSIGRFMCVCKQWHSFLTTPVFTKMHLHHVNNNQNDHKLLVVPTAKPFKYFCTIDCETPEVGLSANRSLPFEVGRNKMSIISCLNGLVCVGIEPPVFFGGYNYLDIILWNPLTGDYKNMLSKGNYLTMVPRRYGLYYSCCDDDYKLLLVTQSCDAYIYSWKSDSWRKAKSRVDFSPLTVWKNGCLVKENLYFLAQNVTNGSCSEWSSLIIRFDTKTERFTQITPPSWEDVLLFYSMMVVRECIHLCVMLKRNSYRLELWKMDGDGREWTKVIRSCTFLCKYQPWHLMKNGNWLLHSSRKVWVYVYEDDPDKAEKVCRYTTDAAMYILPRGKFVETIVSLTRSHLEQKKGKFEENKQPPSGPYVATASSNVALTLTLRPPEPTATTFSSLNDATLRQWGEWLMLSPPDCKITEKEEKEN